MKNILITGSTDGIGKLSVIELAKEGHHIYVHGKNPQKVESTILEIKEVSNNTNIKGFVSDFSGLKQVKELGKTILKELPRLDVLINNAGVFKSTTGKNKKGMDLRFVVNYLSPYLLTQDLLSLLENTPHARIINLSSAAQSPISLEALQGTENISVQQAYAQSKLALTLWSFDLAKKLQNTSVIAVNPGSLLNTKMVQEAYGKHWSSANKGASILCDLAASEKYQNMSGKYFDNDFGGFNNAHPDTYDQTKIKTLIEVTESIIKNV